MNELQAIAADYADHGLTVFPALPGEKRAAIHWKPFQVEPPSSRERDAMFAFDSNLNIAVACGSASGNLAMIDAETQRAFEDQLERCDRAGIADTWIDRSPSGGGHIWLLTPVPVESRGKIDDVEVLAQKKYGLVPPSIAVSKTDGSLKPYQFVHQPPQILRVESLEQLHWLNLTPATLNTGFRAYPRKAQALLAGEHLDHYDTRSDVEQAIVTVLVNDGFSFPDIVSAFRSKPAAGKFSEIERREGTARAEKWLHTCYQKARFWCASESPARRNASQMLAFANSIPWPGRTGSTDRAVFVAHIGIAYQSGRPTYHASSRDLAERAGCGRITASKASRRLKIDGFIQQIAPSAHVFAARYRLPDYSVLMSKSDAQREKVAKREIVCVLPIGQTKNPKQTNIEPFPTYIREGVVERSSVFLPEAFRHRGLGRAAFEVLQALADGEQTVTEISIKTGRHVQTVRKVLTTLRRYKLAAKTGPKRWSGLALHDIDQEALTKAVGMKGAAKAQQEQHRADRRRHEIQTMLRTQIASPVDETKGVTFNE